MNRFNGMLKKYLQIDQSRCKMARLLTVIDDFENETWHFIARKCFRLRGDLGGCGEDFGAALLVRLGSLAMISLSAGMSLLVQGLRNIGIFF